MPRYKLLISYDGTAYSGWQTQDNAVTIQPLIQKSLETILRHPIQLSGSGRTDAGVHALGQTAHFDSLAPFDFGKLLFSLNALLPLDIRAHQVESVADNFHARYSAQGKIYHYHLHLDRVQNPFHRRYAYHVIGKFQEKQLFDAIPFFLGAHDFTSFAHHPHQGSASYDPIRTIARLEAIPQEGGLRLEFEADGFLYKMVRNITGTLLDVAAGRLSADSIPRILEAKDRKKAGQTAPPHGLFLMRVLYS